MLGSIEDFSMVPDVSSPEETIPVTCWQEISLSEIWIPSHLLTNRRKSSNIWASQGLFRTLEKRGNAKQIESFSVYSDSDNESETDVFLSDDDTFNLDNISSVNVKTKESSLGFFEKNKVFSEFKPFSSFKEEKNVEPNISLQEILCSTTEVDMTSFEVKKSHKQTNKEVETFKSNKKNKNDKKRNKMTKSVTLDKFLEDYTEENKQEDYANAYLQRLYMSQNTDDNIQLKNNYEFPNLSSKEVQFMHSEKSVAEKSKVNLKTLSGVLSEFDKSENDNITSHVETITQDPKSEIGKFVIENIPSEVCDSDVLTILYGYGEIKDFALEPDGDFLKAVVEIDSSCNIDWLTECLNGSEPFGASSGVLKCYKL